MNGPIRGPRVLLIDDDPDFLERLGALLTADRFEVATARSGLEGIESAAAEKPALIFLDALMPVMDGFEACRVLKAAGGTQDIPVVFMTSLDRVGEVEKAFACGADDYIVKSPDARRILAKARKWSGRGAAPGEGPEKSPSPSWIFRKWSGG